MRRRELGEHRGTVVAAGERVGELGRHEIDDADPLQERHQGGSLRAEHLAEQVSRHAVVIAGEGLDRGRYVRAAEQGQREQTQPGCPPLGAPDQPLELRLLEIETQTREQVCGLLGTESQIARPHLGEQPGQPQPLQRPRRVSPRRDHEGQLGERPLDEPQQPRVYVGRGHLVQVVQDEHQRAAACRSAAASAPGRSAGSAPPPIIPRSPSEAPGPATGSSAAATLFQKAIGSSSLLSSVIQADPRSAAPVAIHEPTSNVFPQPAVAATTVTGHSSPADRRDSNRGRGRTWVATGAANFTSRSALDGGRLIAGG